jgi:hypothetical protein
MPFKFGPKNVKSSWNQFPLSQLDARTRWTSLVEGEAQALLDVNPAGYVTEDRLHFRFSSSDRTEKMVFDDFILAASAHHERALNRANDLIGYKSRMAQLYRVLERFGVDAPRFEALVTATAVMPGDVLKFLDPFNHSREMLHKNKDVWMTRAAQFYLGMHTATTFLPRAIALKVLAEFDSFSGEVRSRKQALAMTVRALDRTTLHTRVFSQVGGHIAKFLEKLDKEQFQKAHASNLDVILRFVVARRRPCGNRSSEFVTTTVDTGHNFAPQHLCDHFVF